MAGIFLKLGPVQSAKTMIALSTVYNYKDRNQNVLLARPKREKELEAVVESHVGISAPCVYVEDLVLMLDIDIKGYDCIVIDDCQYITKKQAERMVYIADVLNVPIVCYGLKTDYKGELFEGTKRLIEYADKLEEIKAVCWCGHKATHNAAINDEGQVIRTEKQYEKAEHVEFVGLCRKHFIEGNLG